MAIKHSNFLSREEEGTLSKEAALVLQEVRSRASMQRFFNVLMALGLLATFFILGWLWSEYLNREEDISSLRRSLVVVCDAAELGTLPMPEQQLCIDLMVRN
jgi:hypothetical protein